MGKKRVEGGGMGEGERDAGTEGQREEREEYERGNI